MHTIKKYANRKLYHTNRKQYITLEGISALVQRGEAVTVIDNESSEDITAQILAQVALQSNANNKPLPVNVLTGLIQAGSDTIAGFRRSVHAAVGGTDDIDNAIEERLDGLLSNGEIDAQEHTRLLKLLVRRASATPHQLPIVPSASDIERLSAQVDALSAAVDQLLAERDR